MEKQNTEGNNQMKKTLIICGSILAVAIIAIVCIILLTGQNQNQTEMLNGTMLMDPSEMTFEEFCMGMKKDLPQETMDEVKRLYEEMQKAFEDEDMDKVNDIYEQLDQLDVYDFSQFEHMEKAGAVIITDKNGNEVTPPDEILEQIENAKGQ